MAPDRNKLKPCVLLDRTVELMQNRSRSLTFRRIADDTGLSMAWLESFSQQVCPSPTVRNVCCLYEYLSGTQLIVN